MEILNFHGQDKKLVKFLSESFPKMSYASIQKLLRLKDVKVNGKRVGDNVVLKDGDELYVYASEEMINGITLKPVVDYEDDNIIICDKPVGIEVESDKYNDLTLSVNAYLKQKNQKASPVHRIDRNTTGLVVLAKNEQSKQELEKAFKLHAIEKFYTCVVVGQPKVAEKNMTAYLVKDSKNSFVKIFDSEQKGACEIKTNYKLLKTNGKLSLLQVELLTGKTHQIRAHLAHENLPILGDEKYGNKLANKLYGMHRQLLASTKLVFHFNSQSVLKNLDGK